MKSLKSMLAKNELVVGGWVMIGHPAVGEIMARAGYDFVTIDIEHTAIDFTQMEHLIRAIQLGGSVPLVRLTNNDPNTIKRVMDTGAGGIIIPMIKNAEEAAAGVSAMYYPPRGSRGVGLGRAQKYGGGSGFADYQQWLAKEAVCIVQIEHIDAVRNLEAILSVPGIDGYMLGPYDLSASMGLAGQLEHADVLAAIDHVYEVAQKMKKPGGIHIVEPDPARLREAAAQGFTLLAYSLDTRIIDTAVRTALKGIKA